MKKAPVLLLCAACAAPNPVAPPLVGTWQCEQAGLMQTLRFNADNTLVRRAALPESRARRFYGTWQLAGKRLTTRERVAPVRGAAVAAETVLHGVYTVVRADAQILTLRDENGGALLHCRRV
ncbi:hypothetical protein [Conchiformibius kuhniae]|uniref:Lipoprotein n=1 Tax=Conchiformibius kuhniae TaxID=211502 RepID=A0A8T9MVU8_9NEIS|nr:hypothetical protein [Conchiformibius kuhniae]UOP04538.1 hypothetical protein LVJ77_09735 [Conchiformibius kuhniae]